jgi:hypothetical protein
MAVRMSRMVVSRSSTTPEPLGHIWITDPARQGLGRHAGGEQALDHRVVQFARDALAVLEQLDRLVRLTQPVPRSRAAR